MKETASTKVCYLQTLHVLKQQALNICLLCKRSPFEEYLVWVFCSFISLTESCAAIYELV
jgi:hypothetical protein